MKNIFITGANRGIGLEFVRQFLQREATRIFAACRTPQQADELNKLDTLHPARLTVIPLEVANDVSIAQAARLVGEQVNALDLLINNAGIEPPADQQTFEGIDTETMVNVYRVNTIAPLMIAKALVDLLEKGENPRLVNISSGMGSISERDYGGSYAYCASKAALNMTTRGLSADLHRRGIITFSLDPGWVQTDMGGSNAHLTPEKSISGMVRVIENSSAQDNGAFLRWDGGTHSW